MSGWKQGPFQIKQYYFCRHTETIRCTQAQENRQKTPTTKTSHSQVHNKQKFKLGTIVDTDQINITLQRRHEKIKHSEVQQMHTRTLAKHQVLNTQLVKDTLQKNKSLGKRRRQGPAKNCQKTHNRKTNYSEIDAQNYKQTIGRRHTEKKKQTNKLLRSRLAQLQANIGKTKHSEIDAHK